MASKSICSRCLRQALTRPVTTASAPRRAFSSSAPKRPSGQRRIHRSSRVRAVAPQTQSSSELPAYDPDKILGRRTDIPDNARHPVLQANDLFHSFTNSPSPVLRQRAAVMRQNAYCPHPDHQQTRHPTSPTDLEHRKTGAQPPAHVRYECPDCGIPVSCSEQHFVSDYESHLEICDVLREINEDDHDLHSGRFFPEFEYPGPQLEEAQVNLTNWDTLLFSREFNAVNDERSMRQVTRLLTYPITVGSVLHDLSPYSLKHRLTAEGLRSLSGENNFTPAVS